MNKDIENIDWEFELSQYIDGQLEGLALERLLARLREDPALREQLALLQSLEMGLDELALDKAIKVQASDLPNVDEQRLWQQRADIASALERRGLLSARRHRPSRVIRLSFGALAAAAAIAIVATIAMHTFDQSSAPAPQTVANSVEVRPPVDRTQGASGEPVTVEYRRMDWDELDGTAAVDQPAVAPPGTVVVSIARHEPPREAQGAYADLLYMEID